jgi:hypothetical protein
MRPLMYYYYYYYYYYSLQYYWSSYSVALYIIYHISWRHL